MTTADRPTLGSFSLFPITYYPSPITYHLSGLCSVHS